MFWALRSKFSDRPEGYFNHIVEGKFALSSVYYCFTEISYTS